MGPNSSVKVKGGFKTKQAALKSMHGYHKMQEKKIASREENYRKQTELYGNY